MSKLIQQLADQAKAQVPQGILSPELWIEQYNQRFAELIVKECCQMMMDLEVKYPANLTVREIKKHFGVQ
jgi:hypothetical protein